MPYRNPDAQRRASRRHYERNRAQRIADAVESKRRLHQRNARLVYEYLLDHPCIVCAEPDPVVLQFDHRDPETKEANISDLVRKGVALGRLAAEMAKCDVRCGNCHLRKTAVDRGWFRQSAEPDLRLF